MKTVIRMFLTLTLLIMPSSALAVTTTPTPAAVDSMMIAEPADTKMMDPAMGQTEPGAQGIDPNTGIVPPDTGIIPPSEDPMSFLGQDQYYTVNFRGNGEAVVSMKAIFSNLTSSPMETLTYTFEKGVPNDVIVYQLQRDKQCMRYLPIPEGVTPRMQECAVYQEANYYDYWYGQTQYVKAEAVVEENSIRIVLPRPIAPERSGSIVLYYRAPGYASKTFTGSYKYTFETLKSDDSIRNLQVGIMTDSDWKMKGVSGGVQYGSAVPMMASLSKEAADRTFVSGQMDNFYQQIGFGTLTKYANNLQSGETYKVSGEYAQNWVQLYGSEIITAVLVSILAIVLIGMGIRFLLKKMANAKQNTRSNNLVISAATSFISALLMAIVTAVAFGLSLMMVYVYTLYQVQSLIMAVLLILTAGTLLFLFIVPPLVIGIKRGLWTGVATAGGTIGWLLVFGVITLIISGFYMLKRNDYPYIPYDTGGVMMKSEPMMDFAK